MATTHQSSTKQDILEYLLKHSQATAFELAAILEVSPQAIRRHLKDLETEDLVLFSTPEQAGMGRPQHIYQLSHQGRDRLRRNESERLRRAGGDSFGNGYGGFAVSLLDTLAETVGRDQVKSILQKQWERKAQEYRERLGNGSLEERVANLVELRKAEGFMAECHSVKENDSPPGKCFILMEHNCAISNVAESFPSVCGHELEMFAAVLPDCTVERTHWIINGEHRCGYLVQTQK
ncbi:iron-sulfur cluster biosynthesis transcriptional regulator SufR [Cylindrospermum sp. FACHB-282]|uniref:iron-sulfur cluster biosynthesis transcriptional regulator SufR n=1 Tax=Cylindrospermum sp. FACHB-282 TaxID=2692794 RepID=UPI001684955B|nr:iron-sulfur cluster biosynthesis transcriptional regulator SufR [Cylindrospermum sp. FACHB-282]MBD2388069.1 iron-sulfur cluster biosynthesis transcriptional regulator SufR [Cylindrospermum sp. FACHB-282]